MVWFGIGDAEGVFTTNFHIDATCIKLWMYENDILPVSTYFSSTCVVKILLNRIVKITSVGIANLVQCRLILGFK